MCTKFGLPIFYIYFIVVSKGTRHGVPQASTLRTDMPCNDVCQDLADDDKEPVCMIFSRYKKGYQLFVNLCHARRTLCKENTLMHIVHSSRCLKSRQFFMPIN